VPDPRPVVVLIGCDPRQTGRAFEAMRIAVGIVAGESAVAIVLTAGAVHLLDDDTDDLVDGDDIAKFRANLRRLGVPFHVATDALPAGGDWNGDSHRIVPVGPDAIAALVSGARRLLAF